MKAHLQVHVMENPAYDILLGRPFEVLTRASSQNDQGGGCTLTITDPNTFKKSTMVTWARGAYKPPGVEQVLDAEGPSSSDPACGENGSSRGEGFQISSRS